MKVHEFQHELGQTSGIFGRNKEAYVTFSGDGAYTDGKQVNLPAMPSDAELTPEQTSAFRGYLDHEAGHLRHSNMPLLMDTYSKWIDSGYNTLKDIQNSVEDIWLEQRVMREYPGSAKNLRAVTGAVNEMQLPYVSNHTEVFKEINGQSACLGITAVGRRDYNATGTEEVISHLSDEMIAHSENWTRLAREAKNTEELIELAKSIHKLLREDPQLQSNPEDFDPKSGGGEGEGEGSDAVSMGNGGEGKDIQSVINEALSKIAEKVEKQVPGGDGLVDGSGEYGGPHKVYTTKYDRYITRKNAEAEDYSTLFTQGNQAYDEVKTSIQSHILVMKNKLKRSLLAKEMRDWDFGREHGKLDSKRLSQAYMGSSSVYKKRSERLEEDTAVLFLVDLSGSMLSRGKIKRAQETAIALSECLEGTSIKYAVIGFGDTTYDGYDWEQPSGFHRNMALHLLEFKGFESPLRTSRSSLGQMHNHVLHHNSDPCAIRKAVNILKDRPEKRKVLITLSDGRPETHTEFSSRELVRQATIAIKQGKKKGVQCVGIGICDDTVERIYPDYIVIKDVKDLATKSFKKLTDILLNKSIQRN